MKDTHGKKEKKRGSMENFGKKPFYKKKWLWIAGICFLGIGIFIWLSLSTFPGEAMEDELEGSGENVYSLFEVRENDPTLFDGKVEASHIQEVYVDPALGSLTDLQVEDGQQVEADSLLFSYTNQESQRELESLNRGHSRLTSQKGQAEADLANARNALNTADTNMKETNQKINQHLANVDPMSESYERTLEKLQQDLATYEGNKMEAEATLDSLPEVVRDYTEQLEDLTAEIESIRSNVTTTVNADTTGLVQINQEGLRNPEVPYVRIVSEEIKIEATVSEYDYEDFSVEMPVFIRVLNSDQEIAGSVSAIGDMPIEVELEGTTASQYPFTVIPKEAIHYGYSVQVGVANETIYIPYSVVFEINGEQAFVFVYSDGTVSLQEIEVSEAGNLLSVESGLEVGEMLVYEPFDLEDGQAIEVDLVDELDDFEEEVMVEDHD